MPKRIVYMAKYVLRMTAAKTSLRARWIHFVMVTKLVFVSLDPKTIRVLLAAASFLWAAIAYPWPFIQQRMFDLPGYQVLRLLAPVQFWCVLFVMHGLGVAWRFYEGKERPMWQNVVNGFGFALWAFVTGTLNLSTGAVTPGSALEWIAVVLALWAFVLTGRKTSQEVTTL